MRAPPGGDKHSRSAAYHTHDHHHHGPHRRRQDRAEEPASLADPTAANSHSARAAPAPAWPAPAAGSGSAARAPSRPGPRGTDCPAGTPLRCRALRSRAGCRFPRNGPAHRRSDARRPGVAPQFQGRGPRSFQTGEAHCTPHPRPWALRLSSDEAFVTGTKAFVAQLIVTSITRLPTRKVYSGGPRVCRARPARHGRLAVARPRHGRRATPVRPASLAADPTPPGTAPSGPAASSPPSAARPGSRPRYPAPAASGAAVARRRTS